MNRKGSTFTCDATTIPKMMPSEFINSVTAMPNVEAPPPEDGEFYYLLNENWCDHNDLGSVGDNEASSITCTCPKSVFG